MATGFFGAATQAAVRNFQGAQGVVASGYVDAATRAAISRVSCGYGGSGYDGSYPYQSYQYPLFSNTYDCGGYGYPNIFGAYYGGAGCAQAGNYYYGNSTTYQGAPVLISLNPQSGAVGTSVTVYGYGLSSTGNTVHFGSGVIANLVSSDGRSVSFTVPSQLSGYGSQATTLGTYNVYVTNASGVSSNVLPFTVTSLGASAAPVITGVSGPTSLSVNQQGTWTITVNNQNAAYLSVSVLWGDPAYGAYASAPQQVYGAGTQTLTFSHAYAQAGTFTITFTAANGSGTSNTSSVTVNVSGIGTSGAVSLSSLSPAQGMVGTQVVIRGSGFSAYDNTVHFGAGGTRHVPSFDNGTTIYYTVPAYVSACDLVSSGVCGAPVMLVTPGSYALSVGNAGFTSNALTFTVQ